MSSRSDKHEHARRYLAAGLRIVPIVEGQRGTHIESWREFQHRAPTIAELDGWWSQWPNANIGATTGRGIALLDFDRCGLDQAREMLAAEGVKLDPRTPAVESNKGVHFWVGVDRAVRNGANLFNVPKDQLKSANPPPQMDIRGDGGLGTLPPSVHGSGKVYRWLVPFTWPLPPAPDQLYAMLLRLEKARQKADIDGRNKRWLSEAMRGVGSGERNDTAARLAGYFLGKQIPVDVVATMLEPFANGCEPPLPLRELRITVHSVDQRRQAGEVATEDLDAEQEVAEDLGAAADRWAEEQAAGPQMLRIPTPLPSLTRMLGGGWRQGTLTYVGARPGRGKSALGLQCAAYAMAKGKTALYVTLEMLNTEAAMRVIAQEGQLDGTWLDSVSTGSEEQIRRAIAKIKAMPGRVRLWDKPIGVGGLARLVEVHAADLVVVDYLQLMDAPPGIRERRIQVETSSAGLKKLAKSFRIPVVCLSSLTRFGREGKNRKPILDDLKETGNLEHDADVVVFLHSEEDRMAQDIRDVEVILAKNRRGRLGDFPARFVGANYLMREETARYADPSGPLPPPDDDTQRILGERDDEDALRDF